MMLAEIGVGISGPGAIGSCHARAIAAAGGRVVAASGPKPDETAAFAAAHSISRSYGGLEDLLADPEVAAVVVSSPSPMHAEQSLAALEAGKHVFCEIPVGLTLADAEEVARVSAASGLVATVGHTLRFHEPYRRVRAAVETGDLQLRHVVGHRLFLHQDNGRRDWTDNVLWHHGLHFVDAALWFLDAAEVEVRGSCGPAWPGSGLPMDVGAVLVTPSGGIASLSFSYHSRITTSRFVLIAEDRTWELRDGRLLGPDGVIVDSPHPDETQNHALEAQDREFLTAIAEGRPPKVTMADVLPAMRVLQTLEDSR